MHKRNARNSGETFKYIVLKKVSKRCNKKFRIKGDTASFLKTSLNMYEKMQEETQENIQNE